MLVRFVSGIPAKAQLKKRIIYFGSKGCNLSLWAKNDDNKVRLLAHMQMYQGADREDWPFSDGFSTLLFC